MSTSRRRRVLIAASVGLGAGAMLMAGWVLASAFESPAQREANAAPPTPRPITAAVERGDLRDTVSFPAAVRRQDSVSVAIPAQDAAQAVVTATPAGVGTQLPAGQPVTEINGRPLIALPGRFAFYRDLQPGDTGPDVRQLQSGLTAAGWPQRVDGVFGASTERALRALYERAGHAPQLVPDDVVAPPDPEADTRAAPASPSTHIVAPRAELVVLPSMPVSVSSVPALGDAVTPELEIGTGWGAPRVVADVPARTAARLSTETLGTMSLRQGGTFAVRVETIVAAADDTADAAVTLVGVDAPLDEALLAQEGTVVLDLQVVAEDALLVPTIAVTPSGGSTGSVRVRRDDGTFHRVAVAEVVDFRGRSAVHPVERRSLHAGDRVRVG